LRHGRQARRHPLTDCCGAFELLNQIAVVGIAGRHAHEIGLLAARDADEQRVAVGRIEAQAYRRGGSGMTVLAQRLEDVRLDRIEVGRERTARAAAADEAVAGTARCEQHANCRHKKARRRAPKIGCTHVAISH
jgi:hypothetical protein